MYLINLNIVNNRCPFSFFSNQLATDTPPSLPVGCFQFLRNPNGGLWWSECHQAEICSCRVGPDFRKQSTAGKHQSQWQCYCNVLHTDLYHIFLYIIYLYVIYIHTMPQLNTIEQLNACGFHTPQLYGIMCIYNYYIYTVHNFTYICIYTNVIQFPYF